MGRDFSKQPPVALDLVVAYNLKMRVHPRHGMVIVLLLAAVSAMGQEAPQLEFLTKRLPSALVGKPYSFAVGVTGGKGPFRFAVVDKGKLPPGVRLQENTGVLTGIPTQAGTYRFTLGVTDSSSGVSAKQDLVLDVLSALAVNWGQPPMLNEKTLSGSVDVANYSSDTFDLTFIAVAVNEIGKAFALGYQHFNLAPNIKQNIPFSSDLPNGHYIVHVDAVAEIPPKDMILRRHLQTHQAYDVNVNR